MMDLILLGGIGLLIYLFIAKRRREQAAAALPGVHQSSMADSSIQPPYYELEPPPVSEPERDLEKACAISSSWTPCCRRPVQGPGHGFFL
jgi:hypothetical protein